jgi:hypothetical protein
MTNVYEWLVEDVERLKSFDGKVDVVSAVHWRCNARDSRIPANQETAFGVQPIKYNQKSSFLAFDTLTKEKLVEWVKNLIDGGAEKIQSELSQKLVEQSTPFVLNGMPGKSRTFTAIPKEME